MCSCFKSVICTSGCLLIGSGLPFARGTLAATKLAGHFVNLQRAHLSTATVAPFLPPEAREVNTPLKAEVWAECLRLHPNKVWVEALISGLTEGIRIGFQPSRVFKRASANCQSARVHPYVVDTYLASERASQRVAGPFDVDLPGVMINRFGVIPKSGRPGKWRLIC